ncbi:MAG TPA: hypothetical protein VL326_16820, partial [Kofleriaceae bacterium]|nr:hypothetical protein [Kofleriaceae bacterium]
DVLAGQAVSPPKFADATQLELFAGTYAVQGMNLVVKANGRRLTVEGPGEPPLRLLPISDHEFLIEQQQMVVVFEVKDGKVVRAIFLQGDTQVSAPRVE